MTMFAKPLFTKALMPMNLQYFAEQDEQDQEEADQEEEDTTPSLEELLKNPEFKKQYDEKVGKTIKRRLKNQQKEKPAEQEESNDQADDKDDKSQSKLDEHERRFALVERKEKRAAVKEYSLEQGFNPRLAAKLLDIDSVEMDEDGEAQNLDELFDELREDFPDLFKEKEEQEEKGYGYKPGASQKNNKGTKKPDSREIGKSAYQRAKQRGRIK